MKPSTLGHAGLLLPLLAACDATVVSPTADAAIDSALDVADAAVDARSDGDAVAACEAPAGPPDCVMGCTGHVPVARVCIDGQWLCPPGAMPMSACVPMCSGPGPVCCDSRTGESFPSTCLGPNAWACPLGTTPQPAATPCPGRDGG
jgi:hypothetical protein